MDPQIAAQLGGLQADSLKNFRTDSNNLSVFIIDDGDDSIKRILAAIACKRNVLTEMDFATFDYNIVEELGIKVLDIPGTTPDAKVNELHIDLNILTADKVLTLAKYTSDNATLKRLSKKKVLKEIVKRINDGDFKLTDVNKEIRFKVEQELESSK